MWRASSSGAGAGYWNRRVRYKCRIIAVGAALTAALAGTSMAGVPAASASATETVIVTSTGLLGAAGAVLGVNGTILTQYHLINAVDATILTAAEPLLAALPGITVTPDASMSVQSTAESTGPHTPSDAFLQETGATRLASAGDTGQGVTVAVMDTGIDNLPDFSGRLIGGVDLTNGGNPYQDSYGHGTFVAGLIAGDGASSAGQYSGEAPAAKLVSIKVAGADGTTHLGTLISGLQWAVDHQSRYGIKILNLSLGFKSAQSTVTNALRAARKVVVAGHVLISEVPGRPRMAWSRGGLCLILRMAGAMPVWPARRISPIARLRSVAMIRNLVPVLTWDASSPKVTSRTQ